MISHTKYFVIIYLIDIPLKNFHMNLAILLMYMQCFEIHFPYLTSHTYMQFQSFLQKEILTRMKILLLPYNYPW